MVSTQFIPPVPSDAARQRKAPPWIRGQAATVIFDRESLYREFRPLVRRLIRQYGDTADIRQELMGEIYCRFCALLDAFEPERGVPLRPYLVRQLTASVHSWARSGWTRRRREISLDTGLRPYDAELMEDPSRDWDDRLALEETIESLPEAIARLSNRQRKVVIWRYLEQRSFAEIASLLDVRETTARSLLRHGLHNLRNFIRDSRVCLAA